jgi:hypothetical protein
MSPEQRAILGVHVRYIQLKKGRKNAGRTFLRRNSKIDMALHVPL